MDYELVYVIILPSLEIRPFSNSLREIHSEGISSESSLTSSVMFKLGLGKIFPNPVFESSSPVSAESILFNVNISHKNKTKRKQTKQKSLHISKCILGFFSCFLLTIYKSIIS